MLTSISMVYAGFDGNILNSAAKGLSLIIGMIILYSFAASRYNVPTFAKTSIGPIGQLSPKLLAPDSRYQKGFVIYFSLLLLLYFALCVIGPKVLEIPGVSIPENWKDSTLWPIGAASALVTVGIAADNRFPGNIENFFRRKAHEAAYIPRAFTTLSYQLASFRLAEWWGKIKESTDGLASIRSMIGGEDDDSVSRVIELREGNMVSWLRGNALLHCLGQLSGEQYGAVKAQEENRNAAKLLAVLQESIRTRIGPWTDPSKVKIDAALANDLETFIDGASVLLASTLLQATPDAREVSATIKEFGFTEIDSTGPQTWMQFATFAVGLLCVATFVVWIAAFLLSEVQLIEDIKNYSGRINQTAAGTVIVYSVAFFVLMYAGERRISHKQWDERLGSQVDMILGGGVPAALIATVAILFLPYVVDLQGVLSILTFNLAVGLVASVFFVLFRSGAARTKGGLMQLTRRMIGAGTWMHAGAALTVAVVLTFATMKLNYEYRPSWSFTAAKSHFDNIKQENTSKNSQTADKPNTPNEKLEREFRELSSSMPSFTDNSKQVGPAKGARNGKSADTPVAPSDPARSENGAGDKQGKAENGAATDGPVIDKINDVCESLRTWSNGLNQNLFDGGSRCNPIEANIQGSSALAKEVGAFGKSLETLRQAVEDLRDYRKNRQTVWEQMAIAGMFALLVSFTFSVAVRFGRIAQLRNKQ